MFDDWMFQVFPVIFGVVFVVVLGVILYVLFSGVARWNRNNHSPRLQVEAQVVAKRTAVGRHSGTGNAAMSHTYTTYYVTFQVASGDRMELQMEGQEYGMLAEGDRGVLCFQGTRYLSFSRS